MGTLWAGMVDQWRQWALWLLTDPTVAGHLARAGAILLAVVILTGYIAQLGGPDPLTDTEPWE